MTHYTIEKVGKICLHVFHDDKTKFFPQKILGTKKIIISNKHGNLYIMMSNSLINLVNVSKFLKNYYLKSFFEGGS